MRAAVYDRAALEGIRVIATRAPPSPPSKGALLVRVKACGVNPVDAKGIIGDKLPVFLRPLARRFIVSTTCFLICRPFALASWEMTRSAVSSPLNLVCQSYSSAPSWSWTAPTS